MIVRIGDVDSYQPNPVRSREGKVAAVIGISTDITDRKRIEERQADLVTIIEETPDFVAFADREGYTHGLCQQDWAQNDWNLRRRRCDKVEDGQFPP